MDSESSQFGPAESATQEDSDHGVIADAARTLSIKDLKEVLALFSSEPIPKSHAEFLYPFDASNSRGQIWAEQPGIRGLIREPTHGGEPEVNCRRRIMGLFQGNSVTGDDCLVECEAGFRAVPPE